MAYEQKLTADGSQAQKELEKLGQAVDKLTAKNKELAHLAGEAAKRQQGAFGALHKEISSGASYIKNMVVQYASVTKGIDMVIGAYQEWRGEITKLGSENTKTMAGIARTITATGDLLRGKELTTFFQTAKGATATQAAEAFGGVSDAAANVSLDRRKALSREVTAQAVTGADMRELGAAMGALSDALPRMPANDIADLLMKAREQAAGAAPRVTEGAALSNVKALVGAGAASPEQAMALAVAMAQANIEAKLLKDITDKVTDPMEIIKQKRAAHGLVKPLTADEEAKNRFAAASPAERLRMATGTSAADRAVQDAVFAGSRVQLMKLDPESIAKLADSLSKAQAEDFAKSIPAEFRKQFPREAGDREAEVRKEQMTLPTAMAQAQAEAFVTFTKEVMARSGQNEFTKARVGTEFGGLMNLPPELALRAMKSEAVTMGVMTPEHIKEFENREAAATKDIEEAKARVEELKNTRASGRFEKGGPSTLQPETRVLRNADAVATNKAWNDRAALEARNREMILARRDYEADLRAGKYEGAPEIQDFSNVPAMTEQAAIASYRGVRQVDPTPLLREIRDGINRLNNGRAPQAPLPDMAGRARREQAMAVP